MAGASGRTHAWIFDFVTMIAVIVGLLYGAVELRQIRQSQEQQAVLELFRTVQTPEYVRGAALIRSLPDGLSAEELRSRLVGDDWRTQAQLRLTFESLGIMVFRGDVSLDWVDEFHRFMILETWGKLQPLILDDREREGYQGMNEWVQWLAERLQERTGGGEPVPAYEAHRNWSS